MIPAVRRQKKINQPTAGFELGPYGYVVPRATIWVTTSIPQKNFRGKNVDFAQVNQRCFSVESGQRLEIVDWTFLVLTNGKLLLLKMKNLYLIFLQKLNSFFAKFDFLCFSLEWEKRGQDEKLKNKRGSSNIFFGKTVNYKNLCLCSFSLFIADEEKID